MATYKEINGTDITVVSSDPSNPVTGEVWYNTTTQKLKGYQQVLGNAWSTGGNMNTGRFAAGPVCRQDDGCTGTWCGTNCALYTGVVEIG